MPQPDRRSRPGAILTLAASWSVLAAILLPPLSYVGYPFYSLEYGAAVLCTLVLGGLFLLFRPIAFIRRVLVFIVVVFLSLLYFYGLAEPYGWLALPAGTALAAALAALLLFEEKIALRVVAAACLAQVALAASATAPTTILAWDESAPKFDNRPIVHIILDEHPGLAAAPREALYAEAVRELEQRYVSAGFTVFPKAYSAYNETRLSLGRLFNPDVSEVWDVVGQKAMYKRAALLEQIGRNRMLSMTQFDYVQFDPWLLRNRIPVARLRVINAANSYPGIVRYELRAVDRLKLAASNFLGWAQLSSGFPLIRWLMTNTDTGKELADRIHVTRATYGYVARDALIDYRRCCSFRGFYYFLHTYFPHHPYIFDRECVPRTVKEWETITPIARTDTAAHYRLRWAMLLDQSLCASHDVMHIVKALDSQPHMRDAMIIIHGDHGARIETKSAAVRTELGQDRAALNRDQLGTFLAIRDGQKPGSVIEDDVRIDAVFKALVDSDFEGLDLSRVRRHPDSPYAIP